MGKIILLTGGVKSGKSARALQICGPYAAKAFIATAQAFDDEMRQRIERHKTERDPSYTTIEEPLDLAAALQQADDTGAGVIVIDCLTVWVNNLLYHRKIESVSAPEITDFLDALPKIKANIIIVTNETNLGFMPLNAQARLYGDILGLLNQKTAALASEVFFMVSGLGLKLK